MTTTKKPSLWGSTPEDQIRASFEPEIQLAIDRAWKAATDAVRKQVNREFENDTGNKASARTRYNRRFDKLMEQQRGFVDRVREEFEPKIREAIRKGVAR